MISFIDENNAHHNAQVSYKVRQGVNGEKTLSGTIYTNDDVLIGIDRGWRLVVNNEHYVVTYAVPKDYGRTIETEFDAVHEFFYDFAHDVAYGQLTDGSHTFNAYLDFIFAGTDYMYENNTGASAMVRQGFGNKNRLTLFNDVITGAGVEFVVHGRLVRIVQRVGSDLTTKVEKNFNMQDLQIEKNINDFITFKRGYGAWVDEEDKSKGRLTVEYESPLAGIYGRLHGEPIVDERYTVEGNLLERLQADVENSYSVSVQLTMEDLTKSGYEYEQPRAGDWLMAINDDINFRQKVRIVSYESMYATDGQLIEHRVVCNSIGAVQRLEAGSAGIKTQLNDLASRVEDTEREVLRVIGNAGDTGRLFYGNVDPDTQYELRAGDMWIDTSGETTVIKHWNGYEWMLTVDTSALQRRLDEAEDLITDASAKADGVADAIDDALVGTGHITLADLLASKMAEDDFETLFFQQSDAIGFTYSEGGIRKAIIAIVDGKPYLKGEHIILDGDTVVDGTFTVTGEMLAEDAVIGQLEATGIDAQDVQIVNLNASNISGGNLELANGLSITHNGKVIFGVNASNQIQMDEDIRDELKGADGADGTDGTDGRGVDTSTVDYKLHTNGTQPPTGTWLETPPNPVKGQYLWTRTVITYTDGSTPTTTYSVAYNATDGTDGVGVSASAVDYAQTTSGTTTPTEFNSTRPAPIKGQYLWTRTIITYTDGTKSTAYSTSYSALDGLKGEQGPQGIQGPAGTNGQSQYVHIRYSANASGASMTDSPVSTTKYIGIAITTTATAPGYTGFKWSKYVGDAGAQGPQGVQGPAGANGQPTYTWIKYADTPTSGMNDFADGKKYIGLAFNKTTQTESTSYADYQWSLMPQNIEVGGRNYVLNSGEERTGNHGYGLTNLVISDPYALEGSPAIVSFEAKHDEGNRPIDLHVYYRHENNSNIGFSYGDGQTTTTEYKRFEIPIDSDKIPDDMEGWVNLAIRNGNPADSWSIKNIKLEKGNIATDWTEAPEDTQAKIDEKADTTITDEIQDKMSDFVEVEGYREEIGAINSALQEYKSQLESGEIARDEAVSDILSLLDKTAVIESNLGEFTQRWNFLDTSITMGSEGLLVGDNVANTGIRISSGRIDFVDNGSIVAEITGQLMKINRGIFVKSAQIGEHQIETIAGGHTIWSWVPN